MSNLRSPATWPLHRPVREPAAGAETARRAEPQFKPQFSHRAGEPLLRRSVGAAEPTSNPPSLESIIAAVSSNRPTHRQNRVWWKKPRFLIVGLAVLAVFAPISVGIAVVTLSSGTPTLALPPLGRNDPAAPLLAPPAAPTFSTAGANRLPSGAQTAAEPIAERREPTRSDSTPDTPTPPPAASRDSGSYAGANSRLMAVAPRTKMAALETGQVAAPHPGATSLKPAMPAVSPPPAAATSPSAHLALAPATAPSPDSKALAEANSRLAAVESERDALAAEVVRLERHREPSSSPEVSPPPPAAASPTPIPAVPPSAAAGVDLSAALAPLPKGMPARVLIRYAGGSADARRRAEGLANALSEQGIEVADLRESVAAIRPELSFSYAPDEAIAEQVGRLVGVAPVRRLQSNDALMARPGTVELNFSGDSHLAAIKTISSRESNHE